MVRLLETLPYLRASLSISDIEELCVNEEMFQFWDKTISGLSEEENKKFDILVEAL